MDTYTISLTHRAQKGILSLEKHEQQRLRVAIDTLKTNPIPKLQYDVTKLSGSDSTYRIRIGWHRIQYIIKSDEKIIEVFDIDRKKDRSYK